MNVIGVDLGVHKVALAAFGSDSLNETKEHSVSTERPRAIQLRTLGALCYGFAVFHSADVVWIEDTIIGNNRKYSIQLAETKGAVMALLAQTVDVRLVDNKAWKKQVVGNGNATKPDIVEYIHHNYPTYALQCEGDQDRYDAVCVGLYGIAILERAEHLRL